MKAIITAIALTTSAAAASANLPSVDAIPPEKVVKTWKATATLSGYDEKFTMTDANAVSVIGGFRTGKACHDQAAKMASQLMDSIKATGGQWGNARVSYGCHEEESYLP